MSVHRSAFAAGGLDFDPLFPGLDRIFRIHAVDDEVGVPVEVAVLDQGTGGLAKLAVSISDRTPDIIAGRSMSSNRRSPLEVNCSFTSKKKS